MTDPTYTGLLERQVLTDSSGAHRLLYAFLFLLFIAALVGWLRFLTEADWVPATLSVLFPCGILPVRG